MTVHFQLGSDEVGYGALAGPLVVCAFASPPDWVPPEGLTDSKKLSPKKRALYHDILIQDPQCHYYVSVTPVEVIDKYGVYQALKLAHVEAVTILRHRLRLTPEQTPVVADGDLRLDLPCCRSIVAADADYPVVSAASVVAKVYRDEMMRELSEHYPNYGFERHKGYGSPRHMAAVLAHGMSEIHRKSYTLKGITDGDSSSGP